MSVYPPALLAEIPDYGWVIVGLGALAGFFYVLFPLIILVQQKFEARPTMISFDPDAYEWPADIQRLFRETTTDLQEMGFEVVDGLFLPSAVQNVKTALVLLVNRRQQDAAMVTAMYAQPVTSTSLKTLYVEFSTIYDDGFVYDVNNSTQMGSFPRRESTELYQLVRIKDVETLYEVHRAIMERDGRNPSQKRLPLDEQWGGDSAGYLGHAMAEEFAAAADDGYLRLTSRGDKYQPTVKGAFLMVWKELWPWKMVRKAQRNQRARQLLNDLAREGYSIDV